MCLKGERNAFSFGVFAFRLQIRREEDDGNEEGRYVAHDEEDGREHGGAYRAVVGELAAEEIARRHPPHVDAEQDAADGQHVVGGHIVEKVKNGHAADGVTAPRPHR